ncbi:uncharacterized protein KNAG_0M00800 [Huiozyma naganishii CBS 8797]|uniref:Uncharacterized protein n=1 Tax=Huiozyma naganishii (strain ATCC MYA-139 / BCRC 22969 / CBS 8797 / KCTC 17520 / NBRC 10181 / NCYC 3082 / Yp74L-3) TaxID=1071383 RepID=J7RSN7_HUIN7|nr:hypothetical protein KNAG_0M00800 [Kazachstania naganishii CBS 8797]CCK72933.1 hypothetical protein KNAG_0M00800 [Kazachstania naganishii CBS 8797]
MEPSAKLKKNSQLPRADLPQFYLLVALYFVQGIPVGLAFGAIPFLLKSMAKQTSFTSLGVFSVATYPYSLKILWSPIVDSCYSRKIGRRRTWIIPVQLVSGLILILLGWMISHNYIFEGVDNAFHGLPIGLTNVNIMSLVWYFGLLVFLCATQDIAVDGWALTILSKQALSYASTAQTVGLNIGYFLSFTVFLSLNSNDFVNKYFRAEPKPYGWVSLGGYMKFSGIVYILLTMYVVLFTKERPPRVRNLALPQTTNQGIEKAELEYQDGDVATDEKDTQDIGYIYRCFLKVLGLPPIRMLVFIHLIAKVAFQCNEGATNLKLLERGFKREDLAVTVLIDVPFEIIFGYYVAKWSSDADQSRDGAHGSILRAKREGALQRINRFFVGDAGVLTPWLWGILGRLTAAAMGSFVVARFPSDGQITTGYFLLVVFQHLLGSFMNTVQFVGISAFHTRIADPVLGGTYMTLLNTLSNFGGTWPRIIVMSMINHFTLFKCVAENGVTFVRGTGELCTTELMGTPTLVRDGYYVVNTVCVLLGIVLYFGFLKREAQVLQKLPVSAWRCT